MKTVVISLSESNDVKVMKDEVRTVIFSCMATSDPSTPVAVEWRKVSPDDPSEDFLVFSDNRVITVTDTELRITVEQNNTQRWMDLMGEYRCVADNGYSRDYKTMTLTVEDVPIIGILSTYVHDRDTQLSAVFLIFFITSFKIFC